jgi:hypothetical protein
MQRFPLIVFTKTIVSLHIQHRLAYGARTSFHYRYGVIMIRHYYSLSDLSRVASCTRKVQKLTLPFYAPITLRRMFPNVARHLPSHLIVVSIPVYFPSTALGVPALSLRPWSIEHLTILPTQSPWNAK